MAKHNDTGHWGEDIACEELVKQGYSIIERNWSTMRHEIDIIAGKGNRIIFAEVKTRTNIDDDPIDAIDRRKMLKMIAAANLYIQSLSVEPEIQFDIFAITGTPDDYCVEHIDDAFYPPLKTY